MSKKKPQQKLSIELVGLGKSLDVAVMKVEERKNKSFLFLELMRTGKWRLIVTNDLVPELKDLQKIVVIRNGEWKGLGFSHKARTQVLELEVYTSLKFAPEDATFQLDQLESGKWRINHTSDLIPDFDKLESFTFHYSEE